MNESVRTPAVHKTPRRDDGAAMLLVMAWSLVVFGLALVIMQSVIRQVTPSDHAERSLAALAAAEAGIEDYRARLLAHTDYTYYSRPDATNAALGGWATVPGGNTTAEYTYAIDSSRAGTGGGLTIVSTGRSQGVTRTVESVLARRSTLDYVYMSDIESTAPYMPAAYSTAADSGGTGRTAQELAQLLCARHWWDNIADNKLINPTATGLQRNQNFCQYADITSSETLEGPVHSNDIFRLNIANYADVSASKITSSCPASASEQLSAGQSAGGVLCPTAHRFIDSSGTGTPASLKSSATVNGNDKVWNATTNKYQTDSWQPSGSTGTGANPTFDTVLQLPKNPDRLIGYANDSGCIYTGPTRIRFTTESSLGYMYVTSPDTKSTNPLCAGGAADGLAATPGSSSQPSKRIALAQFTNLVIYIQNVPRPGAEDTDANQFIATHDNRWTAGAEPTCTIKNPVVSTVGRIKTVTGATSPWTVEVTNLTGTTGLSVGSTINATGAAFGTGGSYVVSGLSPFQYTATGGTKPTTSTSNNITNITTPKKYPYVIPDKTLDPPASSGFTLGQSLNQGFPSELAPSASAFFGGNCGNGDVYVQGSYKGSVTIASAYNIVITGNLTESGAAAGGLPAACTSDCSMLGLIANQFTYIYRPLTAKDVWVADWPEANMASPKVNAAILAVNQCLCSQREFTTTDQLQPLTIYGSIAQKYRCPVGQPGTISGGYTKNYHYDIRLAKQTPPYLVELSYEPWKRNQYAEVTPLTQTSLTKTWPLATGNDTGAAFANLKVAYGPATATLDAVNKRTTVTLSSYPLAAGKSGLVVLAYDVTKSVGSPAVAYTEARRLAIQVQ